MIGSMLLIGAMSNLKAQSNLRVNNTTGCAYNLTIYLDDNCVTAGPVLASVAAGASTTIVTGYSSRWTIIQVYVEEVNSSGSALPVGGCSVSSSCGCSYSNSIPYIALACNGGNTVNLSFTPASPGVDPTLDIY